MKTITQGKAFAISLLSIFATTPTLVFPGGHRADGTTAGNQTYVIIGPSSPLDNGDFINDNFGLNNNHRYYIEVPPGTSNLRIDIFDADAGAAGYDAEGNLGLDLDFGSGELTYRLRNPTGTSVQFNNNFDSNFAFHNSWQTVTNIISPAAGHWEVEIDHTSSLRNAYGIRAYEQNQGSSDTELNVYWHMGSHGFGSSDDSFSKSWVNYPYITAGCDCATNDYDYDRTGSASGGTIELTSRTGSFNPPTIPASSTSGNSNWNTESYAGWTTRDFAGDYGIWQLDITLQPSTITTNSNFSTFYMLYDNDISPARDTPNPASVQPTGSFRVYMPSDANGAPVKPYVRQYLDSPSFPVDPNPPTSGMTTRVRVHVEVTNPTPFPITFSNGASRVVTMTVPSQGGRNTYQGPFFVEPGTTLVSAPAIGGTGTLVWDPGVVAAGTTERISYFVDVTPTASNQQTLITGSVSTGGTTAVFLDETGNASQSRAITGFGPLCELSILSDDTILDVTLTSFTAKEFNNSSEIEINWETAEELGTAGFYVHRFTQTSEKSEFVPGDTVDNAFVPANGSPVTTGSYQLIDDKPLVKGELRSYYLQEIEFDGSEHFYGPTSVSKITAPPSNVSEWDNFEF